MSLAKKFYSILDMGKTKERTSPLGRSKPTTRKESRLLGQRLAKAAVKPCMERQS